MKKIETIWQHLLWEALAKKKFRQTQKDLATYFDYSLSTVNLAVRRAAAIGAIRFSPKFLVVSDPKKLLFFWATHRILDKDIIYQTAVDLPILEIEGLAPAGAILAGFTAARKILGEAPADYAKVFFYLDEKNLAEAKKRYPEKSLPRGPNLFVLKSYPKQADYGNITSLPQTFVDLWGMSDWYAKDFVIELERKIDELLP